MMRILRVIVLLAVVVALLPAPSSSAQEPVTLRITTWAGVDEAAEFQAIIDEVNASQDAFQIVHRVDQRHVWPLLKFLT